MATFISLISIIIWHSFIPSWIRSLVRLFIYFVGGAALS